MSLTWKLSHQKMLERTKMLNAKRSNYGIEKAMAAISRSSRNWIRSLKTMKSLSDGSTRRLSPTSIGRLSRFALPKNRSPSREGRSPSSENHRSAQDLHLVGRCPDEAFSTEVIHLQALHRLRVLLRQAAPPASIPTRPRNG